MCSKTLFLINYFSNVSYPNPFVKRNDSLRMRNETIYLLKYSSPNIFMPIDIAIPYIYYMIHNLQTNTIFFQIFVPNSTPQTINRFGGWPKSSTHFDPIQKEKFPQANI